MNLLPVTLLNARPILLLLLLLRPSAERREGDGGGGTAAIPSGDEITPREISAQYSFSHAAAGRVRCYAARLPTTLLGTRTEGGPAEGMGLETRSAIWSRSGGVGMLRISLPLKRLTPRLWCLLLYCARRVLTLSAAWRILFWTNCRPSVRRSR